MNKTPDQLNDMRWEVVDLVSYLGAATDALSAAVRNCDENRPNVADHKAIVARTAFREVERIAKVIADTCHEWQQADPEP
jgi:hypothetical protein